MSQGTNQSYLDLSVHPALASYVLSSDPVVVFSSTLETILWANAAGAALFGGKGVIELLEANLSESQAFVRQLKDAVKQMKSADKIIRGFRINQGLRSALLQFEITHLELDQGDFIYRVKCDALDDTEIREDQLARRAVASLDSFADAAAIVDDYGLPIASSDAFGRIGPTEQDLLALIKELQTEEDRLIKRPINSSNGKPTIAGLGRFAVEPGRTLIVLAKMEEKDEPSAPEASSMILLEETSKGQPSKEVSASVKKASAETTNAEPIEPVDFETSSKTKESSSALKTDSTIEQPQQTHEVEPELEPNQSVDANSFDPSSSAPITNNSEETIRFAWSTDTDGKFVQVTEELAAAVGPNAASILGKDWPEIAERMGLDEFGEVAAAFEKQDTWSGKTVMWPIEGADMVVPIDLAALPVFDASRQFGGFKGFGTIRNLDAVIDAEAKGLNLNSTNSSDDSSDGVVHLARPQDEKSEKHAASENSPQIGGTSEDVPLELSNKLSQDNDKAKANQSPAKVVRLVPRSNKPAPTLSPSEDSAFKKIAETLKNESVSKSRELRKADTSLIEKLPVAIFVYRAGEPLFANAKFLEVSGYEDLAQLKDAGGFETLFDHDDDNESPSTGLIKKTGEILPIAPILHKVKWAGESALQLSFPPPVEPVISAEPPAIEMTQVSEIQSILDTTSDGIVLLSEDGEILSVNASAETLFSTTFDAAVGEQFNTLFAPESHRDITDYIESISQPGIRGVFQKGLDTIGKVGNEGVIPIYLTVARLETSGKLCAVVRDMSSWKKTEQELIRSRREAERASEEKSEFLAKVSHEIRTPLNAIIGFSDLMIEQRFGPIESKRYREYLQDINRSGKHVLELVNDLLDLSKIESGKVDLDFEAVNLNTIATECVALMQPNANANRIIIRTSLSRSVPKVVADTRSIKQIIINLLSNAIKYSPSSSQVIVSTVYEDNGEVALRIRDAGNGMDDEEIVEALKPYSRLRGAAETSEIGTGLGLSLTKALVEANRAIFGLESEPGVGTIAHVQFPVQRVLTE